MIPDPKNKELTPESVILDILSRKPRLAMRELYEYFQKKYRPGMTIQGLYKLVKQLTIQRVLVKEGHLVSIDASWIHTLINFTATVKWTYLESEAATANILLKEGESKTFTFERVVEMDNFWWHILATVIHYYSEHEHKDQNVYNYNAHSWFQLVRTDSEQALAEAFEQKDMEWYLVTGSESFLDTLVGSVIESPRFYYRQVPRGELFEPNKYVEVIGDFIIEASLPNYIYELMEKVYDRVRTIGEFNAQDILTLINQPGRTHLTISRDKRRAEVLRNKIKAIFPRRRYHP